MTAQQVASSQCGGKIIVLAAPSGTGKSTIIARLMQQPELRLSFGISATCRAPRGTEKHGVEYYFLSPEEFKARVEADAFVEWEEVYEGCCYGTLKEEVERVTSRLGRNLVMDLDVKGALSIKRLYGDRALTIFVEPPSVEELERRLRGRGTDAPEVIARRLAKAEYELEFAPKFDAVVVNDDLEHAVREVGARIGDFLER